MEKETVRSKIILVGLSLSPLLINNRFLTFLAIVIAIGYKLYSKDKIPFIKKGKIPYISKNTEA